jgi:hypothetical protein
MTDEGKTDGDAAVPGRISTARAGWNRWPLIYITAACGADAVLLRVRS